MFFLDVELEGDGSWLSSCDSDLDNSQIEPCKESLNQDVAKDGLGRKQKEVHRPVKFFSLVSSK